MNPDDLDPPKKLSTAPRDLTVLGIAEIEGYIASLQAEIERARAAIAAKEAQRKGADALFKR